MSEIPMERERVVGFSPNALSALRPRVGNAKACGVSCAMLSRVKSPTLKFNRTTYRPLNRPVVRSFPVLTSIVRRSSFHVDRT